MIRVKCIAKLRDKNNVIYGYTLQDEQGNQMNVNPDALKNAIKANQVKCINLTLTSNNRLVDCTSPEVFDRAEVEKRIKPASASKTVAKNGSNIPSIFGISVKSVKTLTGREGEYYCGVVYKDGKKLGNWSQSPYGAIVDDYYFDEKELNEAAKAWSQRTTRDAKIDKEGLMYDIVILTEYYKLYNKCVKNGRNTMVVVTDEYDMSYHVLQFDMMSTCKELPNDVLDAISKYKKAIAKSGYTPVVKVFRSVEDFIIK